MQNLNNCKAESGSLKLYKMDQLIALKHAWKRSQKHFFHISKSYRKIRPNSQRLFEFFQTFFYLHALYDLSFPYFQGLSTNQEPLPHHLYRRRSLYACLEINMKHFSFISRRNINQANLFWSMWCPADFCSRISLPSADRYTWSLWCRTRRLRRQSALCVSGFSWLSSHHLHRLVR